MVNIEGSKTKRKMGPIFVPLTLPRNSKTDSLTESQYNQTNSLNN